MQEKGLAGHARSGPLCLCHGEEATFRTVWEPIIADGCFVIHAERCATKSVAAVGLSMIGRKPHYDPC